MKSHLILEQTYFVMCVCLYSGTVIRCVHAVGVSCNINISLSLAELQRNLPGHHPATLRCERSATTHWPENQTEQRGYRTGTQTLQMLQ